VRITVQTTIQTVNRTNCMTKCQFFLAAFSANGTHRCCFGKDIGRELRVLRLDAKGRPIRCPACRKAEVSP